MWIIKDFSQEPNEYFQNYFLKDQKLDFLWKSFHGPNSFRKLKF